MYNECPSLCAGMAPLIILFLIAWGVEPMCAASCATDQTVSSVSIIICFSSSTVILVDAFSPCVLISCIFI